MRREFDDPADRLRRQLLEDLSTPLLPLADPVVLRIRSNQLVLSVSYRESHLI